VSRFRLVTSARQPAPAGSSDRTWSTSLALSSTTSTCSEQAPIKAGPGLRLDRDLGGRNPQCLEKAAESIGGRDRIARAKAAQVDVELTVAESVGDLVGPVNAT
jgi:hypothetical protein